MNGSGGGCAAWRVGEVVPLARRELFGEPAEPAWFILLVRPQAELPVCARLARLGAVESWFPTEVAWRRLRTGGREKYWRRIAPGYVFLLTDAAVRWHLLAEATLGMVAGVVGVCGPGGQLAPAPISTAEMLAMRQVPARLEALRRRAEAERLAAARAHLVTGPGPAQITAGALAGFVVDVRSVHAGIARVVMEMLGGPTEVQVEVGSLRRCAACA